MIAAPVYWEQPHDWAAQAQVAGERRRVFCASLADVFEGRDTMPAEAWPAVERARAQLFNLIEHTRDWLDWLLLTKRPENVIDTFARHGWGPNAILPHVWLGTSVENQETADERIPHLLKCPAAVRFLSCEPLLGPVDLNANKPAGVPAWWQGDLNPLSRINWVIVGGESGANARPMSPIWARSLRDQCVAAGVPFFFKQWGEWLPYEADAQPPFWNAQDGSTIDGHAFPDRLSDGDPVDGWWCPEVLGGVYRYVGKKAAGRLLDGRTCDEFPTLTTSQGKV